MATEQEPVNNSLKILMFPWLAFGHITPFLQLAKKLSQRRFYIYLCSTPVNLDSIKEKITRKYCVSIQLVELHLPNLPELPPFLHTTNGLPQHLMSTLKSALYKAKPELSKILVSLKPDLVIHDFLQPWTAALASRHNIPTVSFATLGAASFSYIIHSFVKPGFEFPFPAIHISEFEQARFCKIFESAKAEARAIDPEDQVSEGLFNVILLISSSIEIEGKYVDYLSELFNRKVFPFCPVIFEDHRQELGDNSDNNELIKWLGKKSERSSVFVSFGSEYFLNKEEIEEIAYGLELSNMNFIWVLRFPKGEKTKIEEALPEDFLERVKDRGRIVEGWAPQAKILSHPSTGGFVSHCGWNSVLESIEIGVPIIAMPMNLDQPFNARLVVEIGVGIEVMRDEKGRLKREHIAEGIRDVVIGKTGENLRTKASDLNDKLKAREREDFDVLVEMLRNLCPCPSSMIM